MAELKLSELLTGYEKTDNSQDSRFWQRRITGSLVAKRHSKFFKAFDSFSDKLSRVVCYTSTRGYGLFFLGFGLLSLLLHFVKDYFNFYNEVPLGILIMGAVFAILGLPFLTVDKPLFVALQSFRITDFVFFEFFCVKRMQNPENEKGIPPYLMLIIGLMLAMLGAVLPMGAAVIGIVSFAYLFLTFMSPEFSLLTIFLALPFLSEIGVDNGLYLSVMVVVTVLSFARKVAMGKRVYYFEQYDLGLIVMASVFVISCVIFNVGAPLEDSIYFIALSFGYTLTGSLISNRRLADCVVNSVAISSIPVSILAIYTYVAKISKDAGSFEAVKTPFASGSSLAVFLVIAIIFCVYFVKVSTRPVTKLFYAFIGLADLFTLCLTMFLPALVVLVIALIAYPVSKMRGLSGVFLAILAILPYSLAFIPLSILEKTANMPILSYFGLYDIGVGYRVGASILLDNLFGGTGIGEVCFEPEYYLHGGTGINCGSFVIQLGCEAGIFAVAILVILFGIRLVHRSYYRKFVKDSQVSELCRFITVTTVSLVWLGAFCYLWEDSSIYYLFWCVFAVGSAVFRISRREFDEREEYYRDGSTDDSSSVDVMLGR